jgi:hypothetical protein
MPPKTKETVVIPNDEGLTMAQVQQLATINAAQQNHFDDLDDVEKTDEDYLQDVFAELGGSGTAKVNVYQVETGKPLAFVGSFAPDMFSVEAIQQSYGAGEYAVHVRVDGRIKTKRTIRIAAPKEKPNQNNGAISTHDIAAIVRDTVRDIIPAAAPPVSRQEILSEMAMMKEIFSSGNNDNKPSNGIDDFLKMLEVARGLVSPAPEAKEPTTGELVMNGLNTLAPILAAGMQRENRAQPMRPAMPAPNPAPAPAQDQPVIVNPANTEVLNPESDENAMMNFQQKLMLDMLIKNAANDNDPVTYANVILDLVGGEKANELLNRDDWFTWLVEQDARVQSYQQWFIELRAIVLDLASQELNFPLTNSGNDAINDGNTNDGTVTNSDNAIPAEQS